jgi:biopolymer transport protein ExbB
LIGTGLRLDGGGALTVPASSSLAVAADSAWSFSIWAKPAALQPNAALYYRRDGAKVLVIGFDNGSPFVEVTNAGVTQRSAVAAPVAAGGWHHVAVVAVNSQVTLYLDGAVYGSLTASLPALNTVALVGGDTSAPSAAPVAPAPPAAEQPVNSAPAASVADGAASAATPDAAVVPVAAAPVATTGFAGDVDELQIGKIARPAGFIKFAAINQGTDPAKLIAFSVDEETASWLSGYFAVILKSVTLDGWVVIGILLIMAALSWVVMMDRIAYLGRQARANARFMQSFREADADLSFLDRGDAGQVATLGGRLINGDTEIARSSSLYRIYIIGATEIRRRFGKSGASFPVLSATSIAAIRASLDGGVVKEMQGLNRLMVVLTIAISGGPFLGLLGTVVGVMITFAAIAASGDVNVNAIAPGIAAALVATVAGLGVAIPALFGYNYLISRIKDLTNDIQIFVDELVTRMAELYDVDRPDPVERQIAAE